MKIKDAETARGGEERGMESPFLMVSYVWTKFPSLRARRFPKGEAGRKSDARWHDQGWMSW